MRIEEGGLCSCRTWRTDISQFAYEPTFHKSVADDDFNVKPGLYGCPMGTEVPRNIGVRTVLAFDPEIFLKGEQRNEDRRSNLSSL